MAKQTGISWTHHTFNPWWGCTKVKLPGGKLDRCCAGCYAERDSKRYGFDLWGVEARRRFFNFQPHWNEPLKWNRDAEIAGERQRVFCASMADVFESLPYGHPDTEAMTQARKQLWDLIKRTPRLDWLILTKRIELVNLMIPGHWFTDGWPDNVWLGTSVGAQEAAWRIDELLKYPAIVRFISYEPAYGPLDLERWLSTPQGDEDGPPWPGKLDWVITGGESGPHAAPSHPQQFRDVRDQCIAAGVPFHFKQWGEWLPASQSTTDEQHQKIGHIIANNPGAAVAYDPKEPLLRAFRIGKKAAGRLLDGQEWLQFPNPDREAFNAQKDRR